MTARRPTRPPPRVAVARAPGALAAALLVLGWRSPPAGAVGADGAGTRPSARGGLRPPPLQPTIQYDEAVAHAGDKIAFAPGDRVTVPFKPRAADRWAVGGVAPRALPAGRADGHGACARPAAPGPPAERRAAGPGTAARSGPADVPYVDPGARARTPTLAAAVDPGGLQREVFGFLPYWELTDQLDPARLGEALDHRLLRGRGRRQRQPPEAEQRRLDRRSAGAAGRARR